MNEKVKCHEFKPYWDFWRENPYPTPIEWSEMMHLVWQSIPLTIPQTFDDEENPDQDGNEFLGTFS